MRGSATISRADEAALKSFDVLQSYCELHLAPMKRAGSRYACSCPWGTHTKPYHLEIATGEHGAGVCYCHACGRGGTVVDVAAAIDGLDPRANYSEVLERVAAAVGYSIDKATGTRRRRGRKTAGTPKTAPAAAITHTAPALPVGETKPAAPFPCVEESARLLAMEAVDRAAANPDRLTALAADFGLPARALTVHADIECHQLGLIGLTPRGLLLFISTRIHEGKLYVTAIKARAPKRGTAPAEVIENGQWVIRGTLDAVRKGGKFRACTTGTGVGLWGRDAVADHDTAIITEGESDKLAADLSLDIFREAWQTGLDDLSQYTPERNLPAVVACAGCSAFKPEWAPLFRGKNVIICGDNDTAGAKGIKRTARILLDAGALTVKSWTPGTGCKDAREQFDNDHPAGLIEDIILRNTPLH